MEAAVGRQSWFDPQSNQVLFDHFVERLESWQQAIADGIITSQEIQKQAELVAALLRELEPKLSDELHDEVTRVLYELAVFNEMQRVAALTQKPGNSSQPGATIS
jgi:predicted transcriptional regulator